MISQEMLRLGQQSSVIRAISEYGAKRKKEIGAERVFDFSLGNPSIPAPAQISDSIVELVREISACQLHGYTSSAGDFAVREAIAENIKTRFSAEADPSLVYMTCGAAAGLTVALHALCNPEDEVLVPAPFFPEYRVFVEKTGARLVPVPSLQPSFALDLDGIAAAITPRTKALIVNTPNNPTGAVYSKKSLEALAALLREKSEAMGTEIYLISDEPYRELYFKDGTLPWLPNLYERTLVVYSYSKSLSLPGERIGYLAVSPDMPEAKEVFAAVCGAGRALGFVCAPSLWQYLVGKNQGVTADVEEYRRNRDRLVSFLREVGYTVTPPDGAFYLFVKSPEEDAAAFAERAKAHEILVVPSDSFGVTGYVRVAYCVSYQTIEGSLAGWKALWEEYQK